MRESYNASYFHVHKFFLADIGDCLGIAQSVYDLRVNVWYCIFSGGPHGRNHRACIRTCQVTRSSCAWRGIKAGHLICKISNRIV